MDPAVQRSLGLFQFLLNHGAVGQALSSSRLGVHQCFLKLAEHEADHLLRVLELVQLGVHVGVDDVFESLESLHVCSLPFPVVSDHR
ncbi:hypothetical protein SDC9_202926 [bioreactor metagenome]|uniref:Uncharacterized protein n=1 Tax=bioreactor metagenome TaxID=1076179 RepID=A0A645IVP2_9ZZZZ